MGNYDCAVVRVSSFQSCSACHIPSAEFLWGFLNFLYFLVSSLIYKLISKFRFKPSSCEQEEPLYESPLLYNLSNLYDYSLLFINDWFALCCLKYLCLLRFLWMETEKNKTRDRGNYEIFFMHSGNIYGNIYDRFKE